MNDIEDQVHVHIIQSHVKFYMIMQGVLMLSLIF